MPEIGKSLTDIDPAAAKVKTGQYTGDGTTSQAITGVGFKPKMVFITPHLTAEASSNFFWRYENYAADLCSLHKGVGGHSLQDNRLISLDADGFAVDDDGVDAHPNQLNFTYDYLCIG